jgi:hypothetical protein
MGSSRRAIKVFLNQNKSRASLTTMLAFERIDDTNSSSK